MSPALQYSGQGHTEVFQDGFHSEQASQGSIKEVEERMSAASIALEVAEAEGQLVSATSRFAWPPSQKEASSEAGSQKACKHYYWNMSCGLISLR